MAGSLYVRFVVSYDRAMDFEKAIERIYDHLETGNVEAATMACLRVARSARDHLNASIFLRELFPKKEEVARTLYDDTSHLSADAQKLIWERSLDRWMEIHEMDFAFPSENGREGPERTILKVAAGEIDAEFSQWERTIAEMAPPPGMTPFDTAAFAHASASQRAQIRLRMTALTAIKARLKTRCLNYATQIEKQLSLQSQNQSLLWNVQNEVSNYFKAHADDVFQKLQKASQLSASAEAEDAALLLTEVRRALKAVADHFYPTVREPVTCLDGKTRHLGEDQYMNRLQEFIAVKLPASTAKELAAAELQLLAAFMRRLNDLASKGVHASVTHIESRQGLVGLYMFLSTIVHHLTSAAVENASDR